MLRGFRWRRRDPLRPLDQVGNAYDATVDLTPVSDAPAQAVREGWAPLASGQSVPLLWEKVEPDVYPDEEPYPWRTR